jgi:hypothetical protein
MLWERTESVECFVCCRTDTKNSDEGYDDGRLQNSEVTTDASDIYNVYYPVMEAQTVVDNGKAFRNTEYSDSRTFYTHNQAMTAIQFRIR